MNINLFRITQQMAQINLSGICKRVSKSIKLSNAFIINAITVAMCCFDLFYCLMFASNCATQRTWTLQIWKIMMNQFPLKANMKWSAERCAINDRNVFVCVRFSCKWMESDLELVVDPMELFGHVEICQSANNFSPFILYYYIKRFALDTICKSANE